MGQSLTAISLHVVFSTKERAPTIEPAWQQRLYDYLGGIVKNSNGALLAAGGTADHVHLLVSLHPSTAPADVIRDLKANSSRWIHEKFAGARGFAWQAGYAAFSVSSSRVEAVRRYIAGQAEHHRRQSFQEELVAFLKRHNVAYDERFIWT